ncbi:MAG: D-glycerate dehydrogenase [Anaerolineaceae bacterium]
MNQQNIEKPKVLVTRRLPDVILAEYKKQADVEVWDEETPIPYNIMLEKVRGKEGLVCLLSDKVDQKIIDAGASLKVISTIAVGFDNIDIQEAAAHGIRVGNTPGVLTEATADLAFSLLMAAARRLGEGMDYVRLGKWKTWGLTLLMGQEVYGRTIGIIGMGRIGQAMAKRAKGFNMRILYSGHHRVGQLEEDLKAEFCPLDDLLRESDYISLHANLKDETRGLIGEREFNLMKPTAILINTARGAMVDQDALYHALKDGKIAYAALDVTDPEPMSPDDRLLTLPNIIVVPHIGSATVNTRMTMCRMALQNLAAGLKGEKLPYPVN